MPGGFGDLACGLVVDGRDVFVVRSCPNFLHEARHPQVPHDVLELLTVDVAAKLLCVFLHSSPPVVLYLVIGPSGQKLCDFRPSATQVIISECYYSVRLLS